MCVHTTRSPAGRHAAAQTKHKGARVRLCPHLPLVTLSRQVALQPRQAQHRHPLVGLQLGGLGRQHLRAGQQC